MSDKRQNNQYQLAFWFDEGGEASGNVTGGTDSLGAERATETPAGNLCCQWSIAQPFEPPYTRTVRTVVWEGGRATVLPIPIRIGRPTSVRLSPAPRRVCGNCE